MSKILLRHTLTKKKFLTYLTLYLYTFPLYENASLIIFSAETEYISTRYWYRNINFLRDRIRRILANGAAVYQWCGFKSRRGKNKNLTALKSNSNTVWFNFQTYIYILSIYKCMYHLHTVRHMSYVYL
jgi:hypothetical protein